MENIALYPPSPEMVPENLTQLPNSYKLKSFLAILAIVMFFLLYAALVVGLGYAVYWAIAYPMGRVNKLTGLLKLGAIAGAIMLFLFTLKFILKLKNHVPENRIKLSKEDYPDLWDFVFKICEETKAPKPKYIYADPDVNAYVRYTNTWLSLFLPVKKELTIGLGLVSCLNLTEFKAVVSHEFGHFAQRTMKIGSFIHSANTIIHDMIYARDNWDDLLDSWRASDLRLSAAAWVITPIIWIIRQILKLFYQFLNLMYSLLSREMEFNADKVAVLTSGSQAIVSSLWHLDSGFENWNNTLQHAHMLSQQRERVKNLYKHNENFHERNKPKLEALKKELQRAENNNIIYFNSSELSKVNMYASHPPNDKREANAKAPFIDCKEDNRSPWLIFGNATNLQETMSDLVYKLYLKAENHSVVSEEEFEEFIQAEALEDSLSEEFLFTFRDRFLTIPEDLKQLPPNSDSELTKKSLINELSELMKPVLEINSLMEKAQKIARGESLEKTFIFNETVYSVKNLELGYNNLFNERENIFNNNFREWDQKFCLYYLQLADSKGKQVHLTNLYKQHKALANVYKRILAAKNSIIEDFSSLQASGEVQQFEIDNLASQVDKKLEELNQHLNELNESEFIPLPNIKSLEQLKQCITPAGKFIGGGHAMFENGLFGQILDGLEAATHNCQRIDLKSMNVILSFHKNQLEEV